MTAPPNDDLGVSEGTPRDGGTAGDEPARVLRRVERTMAAGGLSGALLWLLFVGGFGEALILTLTSLASIVSFRGLQRLVGRLGAHDGGKFSRRSQLSAGLRFATILLLPAVTIWMTSRQALALIAGFSVLPLGLMSEGLWQLRSTRKAEPTDGN